MLPRSLNVRKRRNASPAHSSKTAGGKIYFFSDAHLGLGSKNDELAKERTIVRFLNHIGRGAAELFIVGDLFDFWFEYRTVVPKGYFRLFSALAGLTEKGVRVSYLAGNHDFWLRSYFREELGINVFLDPIERTFRGKRFYIHHGDGLLKNDTGYRILKKVLRNKVNIFLFSLLHPDITGKIAEWSSRTSRKHTSKQHYEENDMVEFARSRINEGFDYVVMGHNHKPLYKKFGQGVYVNLGDWIDARTYAVFDGKRLLLKQWKDT
ncbi:MAG TPA: UDP-2,3-diacylglucosamine diphosphatase [Bacteroidota bacterium]|nr:UDP-2,3-diacylglucosamine diphosphatase [Bacteroidota bacterium]